MAIVDIVIRNALAILIISNHKKVTNNNIRYDCVIRNIVGERLSHILQKLQI